MAETPTKAAQEPVGEAGRLMAMPWRGRCPDCWHMIWFADTENEAAELVQAHIDAEHPMAPIVYRKAERAGHVDPGGE